MRAVDLASEMARRGLIGVDAEPFPFGTGGRPWYISAVLGMAGWLASLFGFLFVAVSLSPDTPTEFAVAGFLMLAASFGLYNAEREGAFFEQLALALSLAGQLCLLWAVGDATESATAIAGLATVLSAGVVVAMPNHFVRVLSTFFGCIAWALAVRFAWWGEDTLFDTDPDLTVALVPALLGWIVIWAPVAVAAHLLIQREPEWMATRARRIARPALTGLLLGLSLGTWASEPFAALSFWFGMEQASSSWLVLWPLLGFVTALFAAVCAFRIGHTAVLGVAIAGALFHVVQFYYMLGVQLVVKSYIMLAVGGGALLVARGIRRRQQGGPS